MKMVMPWNFDGASCWGIETSYFFPEKNRITEENKQVKKICNGYFFYSKSKKMWGFTDKGQNEVIVSNYLNEGHIPKNLIDLVDFKNTEVEREPLPFNVENFQFHLS